MNADVRTVCGLRFPTYTNSTEDAEAAWIPNQEVRSGTLAVGDIDSFSCGDDGYGQ